MAAVLQELFGDARLLLVFDGRCGVCTRMVEWVRARDPAGRVRAVPNQAPGLLPRTGLTRAQVDAAAWAITRNGERFAGAAAVNCTLRELRGVWPAVARLYDVPGLRWIEDRAYHWFSRNRGRFARWGVTPACDRPGVVCEPE
jgi:predicted DCC family thiol-disulfide oxidoreductase YuxK